MCLSFFDFQRGVGTPFAKEANMVNKQLKHRSNIKTIALTLRDLSKKKRLFQPPQDYETTGREKRLVSTSNTKRHLYHGILKNPLDEAVALVGLSRAL
jgi:hypothetical protein